MTCLCGLAYGLRHVPRGGHEAVQGRGRRLRRRGAHGRARPRPWRQVGGRPLRRAPAVVAGHEEGERLVHACPTCRQCGRPFRAGPRARWAAQAGPPQANFAMMPNELTYHSVHAVSSCSCHCGTPSHTKALSATCCEGRRGHATASAPQLVRLAQPPVRQPAPFEFVADISFAPKLSSGDPHFVQASGVDGV